MNVPDTHPSARIWVVMGVSGSGKTTLAIALARRLRCAFCDADDLHPADNIVKMRLGMALTDADRQPWLEHIADWMTGQVASRENGVIACSALKLRYRDRLRQTGCAPIFVAIDADRSLLAQRLSRRKGHFMTDRLLDSQIADYERPLPNENPIFLAAEYPVDRQVDAVVEAMA